MTSLSDVVDVVIGVDTRVETDSAAAVDAHTGAVLGEITVPAEFSSGFGLRERFAGDKRLTRDLQPLGGTNGRVLSHE